MNDLNTVSMIGRLTRDAELKMTASGMAIASFSLACNRSKKQGDEWISEPSFFDCQLWGKSAENLTGHLRKGKQIAVVGSLKQDRWQDKDGANRSKVVINCEMVQLLGGQAAPQEAPQAEAPAKEFEDTIPF